MRNIMFIVYFLGGCVLGGHGQTVPSMQSGDSMVSDINAFLPSGRYVARMFIPVNGELSPQDQELENKMKKVILQLAPMMKDSVKNQEDVGRILARMGITTQELEAYYKMEDKRAQNIRITETDSLEIINADHVISFRGSGSIRPLDSLVIDPLFKRALFGGNEIAFRRRKDNPDSANAFRSGVVMDEFRYEQMADGTGNMMDVLANMQQIVVEVGRLKTTGETTLLLTAVKYVDKRLVMNLVVPVLIRVRD